MKAFLLQALFWPHQEEFQAKKNIFSIPSNPPSNMVFGKTKNDIVNAI